MKPVPLVPGKYYHIYNRGNNRENLFYENDNYQYFLNLYDKYISPIAETYAWCLMKNHFHLLVRIKEEEEIIGELTHPDNQHSKSTDLSGLRNQATQQFSNLFNAYSKAFNKKYGRTGALFQRPFHRIEVHNENYFRQLVVYIHTNPLHHGFTPNYKDYPWSSYGSILALKPTKLCREKVLGWFDGKANFIALHNSITEIADDILFEDV